MPNRGSVLSTSVYVRPMPNGKPIDALARHTRFDITGETIRIGSIEWLPISLVRDGRKVTGYVAMQDDEGYDMVTVQDDEARGVLRRSAPSTLWEVLVSIPRTPLVVVGVVLIVVVIYWMTGIWR